MVAPTAPVTLTAVPRSSSRIDLSWEAATDNIGVQGYLVYRNSVQVASVSAPDYQDTGLQAATSYSYQIIAFDGAGNRSPASVSVSAVTQPAIVLDTTAPSVPTGLSVTVRSSSQISLSWLPSKDNVGVTGYRVYRNGLALATTTNTSYVDLLLAPSTSYSYSVAAYDAAGNSSAKSSGVSKTTWPPLSTKFKAGSHVKTSGSTSVRSQPGGTTLGSQAKGALGTVVSGPAYSNSVWWWQIDFAAAPDGWVNETRIVLAP